MNRRCVGCGELDTDAVRVPESCECPSDPLESPPLKVLMVGVLGKTDVTSEATPELVDSWMDSAVCGESGGENEGELV